MIIIQKVGEIFRSIQSYLRYRGISYNLWKQYDEEKNDDKKKNKRESFPAETSPAPDSSIEIVPEPENENNTSGEHEAAEENDVPYEVPEPEEHFGPQEVEEEETKEQYKKEEKNEEASASDSPFSYNITDLINMFDQLRGKENKINEKTTITQNELINLINKQNEEIYDPEFLNRLLSILYKCSTQNSSDKMLISIANPLNLSSLIILMRLCS
jgi:hypothetical protein